MATLFRILNTGDVVADERRCRQWLPVGEAFAAFGVMLIPLINQAGDIWFQLFNGTGEEVGPIPLTPLEFGPDHPYRVVPRALRLHPSGRPEAVLLETQYTGTLNSSTRPVWAMNREDDDAKHFQSIPDAG